MTLLAARPDGVELNRDETAVVVVDMQNAFASKGGMFDLAGLDISGAAPVVAATARLVAAARTAGVSVVYLQMGFKPGLDEETDPRTPVYHKELALRMMRERPELSGRLLVEGTWDWQIIDALRPGSGDVIVPKARYSGFHDTILEKVLRERGIRTLLFTGIATNICVESTARAAYFLDFWPILIEDAVDNAGPAFTQEATLWAFENALGWVSSTEKAIAAFGTMGERAA